ncbi:MAG: hypothetical protein EZS28_054338, partial [Streblomastix strix]
GEIDETVVDLLFKSVRRFNPLQEWRKAQIEREKRNKEQKKREMEKEKVQVKKGIEKTKPIQGNAGFTFSLSSFAGENADEVDEAEFGIEDNENDVNNNENEQKDKENNNPDANQSSSSSSKQSPLEFQKQSDSEIECIAALRALSFLL